MERWTESRVLYDGRIFRLRTGNVALADGTPAFREVIEHPGGVAVVPFDGTQVTLVKQYRIAVGDETLELPAGKLEPDDLDPEYRGACELEEEAGLKPGRMVYAGYIYGCIGYCTEKVHLYLAFDLEPVPQRLEEDERIVLVRLTLEEVRAGLRAHRFHDAKTVVGLQALLYHLEGA